MNEAAVAAIWQSGAVRILTADSGRRVHVLYPGRRARRPGCDFQDAVLMIGEQRVTGDVEIHVTSSQWDSHGHNLNPLYEGIVLHVVFSENGGLPARTSGGCPVPTVVLNTALTGSAEELQRIGLKMMPACVYALEKVSRLKLPGLLTAAGLARYAAKVERSLQSILKDGPGQALYSAIARSLGYALNATPMEELSRRLPLKRLEDTSTGGIWSMQAVLLKAAGLLTASSVWEEGRPYEYGLEDICRQGVAEIPVMHVSDWDLRVRPTNHPFRRLAALAALVYRYRGTGLYSGLSGLLERENRSGLRTLENGLLVAACEIGEEYYLNGHSLGRSSALLGRGRAAEIILNAVLPCLTARALLNADRASEYNFTSLYLRYLGTPFNEITRHMQALLRLPYEKARGACNQQGLLHLYHSYCREKNCAACPVFTRQN